MELIIIGVLLIVMALICAWIIWDTYRLPPKNFTIWKPKDKDDQQ